MNKVWLIVLAMTLISATPSLAAPPITCSEAAAFSVNEGDLVKLMADIDQEDLANVTIEWFNDSAIVLNATNTQNVTFTAPAVDECVTYNLSTLVSTKLLGSNPAACVDDDCIKFTVCPQTCTSNPINDACWTNFTDTDLWDNNTYKGTVTYNWTIYEITSPAPTTPMTDITYTTKKATLLKNDIDTKNGEPTAEIAKRCFRVEYTVKNLLGQTILSCFTPPEEFCLVYDPEVTINKITP